MHPVEFTLYKAIVLIASALALVTGILNIVYFNRIRLNRNNCSELTSGEVNTALGLNIALVIFAGILFFWSLFRLIFTNAPPKDIVHKTYNEIHHPVVEAPISPPVSRYTSPSAYVSVGTPPGGAYPVAGVYDYSSAYSAAPIQIPSSPELGGSGVIV